MRHFRALGSEDYINIVERWSQEICGCASFGGESLIF